MIGEQQQTEMTFAEIGKRMGVSHQRAVQLYQSGLRKLRQKPGAMAKLLAVSELLQRERAQRTKEAA